MYNDARTAYGLDAAKTFADIISDETVEALLSTAHGGDLDLLDSYTGAVAETTSDGSSLAVGPLIQVTLYFPPPYSLALFFSISLPVSIFSGFMVFDSFVPQRSSGCAPLTPCGGGSLRSLNT